MLERAGRRLFSGAGALTALGGLGVEGVKNGMQGRSQRVGMSIAGVLLCIGVIITTIGVLRLRKEHQTSGIATTATPTAAPTATATAVPLPPGNDWTQYRFDLAGSGLNPENRITASNVAQLQLRWSVF